MIFIPDSFNTNISQPYDYKITFVNSQQNATLKGDFVLENRF